MRPIAPFEERRQYLPSSDMLETWPRRREYFWAGLFFFGLAYATIVGPLDYQAAEVTHMITQEEGARVAQLIAEVIDGDEVARPREQSPWVMSPPLQCSGRRGEQWIRQGERSGFTPPTPRCVRADLRGRRAPR